jgi:mono/diheme cytochrome c family protein
MQCHGYTSRSKSGDDNLTKKSLGDFRDVIQNGKWDSGEQKMRAYPELLEADIQAMYQYVKTY